MLMRRMYIHVMVMRNCWFTDRTAAIDADEAARTDATVVATHAVHVDRAVARAPWDATA